MMIYAIYPRGTFTKISRITLIFLSIGLITIAVWIKVYIIIALSLYLVFLALIIKSRTLEIYDDHFVINSRCWLKRFNTKTEYCFSDIKKVRFSPGYTKWTHIILFAIMGSYRFCRYWGGGELAEPAEWKIIKKDNSIEYIKSIGTDEEAQKAAEYISLRITNN